MVTWEVLKEEIDPKGNFSHQIIWCPPKSTGFIIQRVEVEDPYGLIPGYYGPYYEAWRVVDGAIIYDFDDDEEFDDGFSNCHHGDYPDTVIAKNTTQRKLREAGVETGSFTYHCLVYWLEDKDADDVKTWRNVLNGGVGMAGLLKSSYDPPKNLGVGKVREFSATFEYDSSYVEE